MPYLRAGGFRRFERERVVAWLREQGSLEQLFGINSEIGALMEAINASNTAQNLQKDAARKNLYGQVIGAGGEIAASVLGGVL